MLKRFFYITYVILLVYIVWLLPSEVKPHATVNLVPLQTIRLYITAFIHGYVPIYIVIGNLIGNILLFVPIGIIFYHHLRHMGIGFILFISMYIPAYIEVGQLLLHLAGYGTRSADVDDVLLNMIGIWMGYLATSFILK